MAAYTTTELLEDIKDRGAIPAATNITDAKILGWADGEIKSLLVPDLVRKREKYLLVDYTVATAVGTQAYRIPPRAFGGKLNKVVIKDSSSNVRDLDWVEYDQALVEFPSTQTGAPTHYSILGNEVYLYPSPDRAETLHLPHYRRPNTLVATSAVAVITAVTSATRVTCSGGVPSTMSTSTPVDWVLGTPGYEWVGIDKTPTAKAATTLDFTSTSGLSVGDRICLAGQSDVVQLPHDIHPIVAQLVALRYIKAKGDFDAARVGMSDLQMMLDAAKITLGPRVEEEAHKVSPGAWPVGRR